MRFCNFRCLSVINELKMNWDDVRTVGGDIEKFAWSGIRRFHNVSFVTNKLEKIHNTPPSQRKNIQKQAEQIRYCLIQAKEYFDAANYVSLATKPNLLYYGIMSLALADILFKQDGRSSLDQARQKHKHHGLEFICSYDKSKQHDLTASASSLAAAPHLKGDEGFGTFELWHRSCRETPLTGTLTRLGVKGVSEVGPEFCFLALMCV
jgi:hypothetical protein